MAPEQSDDQASRIKAAAVDLRPENPDSDVARWCLQQYYRELAERFEGGFDPNVKAYAGAPSHVHCIVAWRQGAAAGCGSLLWSELSMGEIKRMWVSPSVRGLGVARRMLLGLEDAARVAGLQALRLDTNRVLAEAHALYRSAGYAEIARYSDNPYAHHWFGKTLAP